MEKQLIDREEMLAHLVQKKGKSKPQAYQTIYGWVKKGLAEKRDDKIVMSLNDFLEKCNSMRTVLKSEKHPILDNLSELERILIIKTAHHRNMTANDVICQIIRKHINENVPHIDILESL